VTPSRSTFNPFELGVPLYAPFFNTSESNPLSHFKLSLNDFGAETDNGYDSYEVPALSTPGAHEVGEGVDEESTAPTGRGNDQLNRCQKKNIKKRAKRLESRKRVQEAAGTLLKACSIKHRSAAMASKLTPQHNLDDSKEVLSHPAWIAKLDEQDWSVYGSDELVDKFGMTPIDWDGRYAYRLTIGVPAAYEF
jgi:hypothetical protein